MKKLISLILILTLALSACAALAATEPNSKTIEETTTYEAENISITIDRWCYAFNRTECRFFVADVVVKDPSQLQTAFAGEKYTASTAEATSEIAGRHNAILAVNGDYYNYKDSYGMIIRNGELYRDKVATRDQLLVYADGRMEGVLSKERGEKTGKDRIAEGVVQSFEFGPLLVRDGEKTELPKKYIINTKDTVREPRTGIGQVDNTHYVIIVADGRREGWSD